MGYAKLKRQNVPNILSFNLWQEDTDFRYCKKNLCLGVVSQYLKDGLLCCEGEDRTPDLRVMSPMSYRCSTSRKIPDVQGSPRIVRRVLD